MEFFRKTNIDFAGKRKIFFFISAVLIFIGLIVIIFVGPEQGIDFVGGTEIAVKFEKQVNTNDVRKAVDLTGIKGAEIKSFGKENQFIIRIKETQGASKIIAEQLRKSFPNEGVEILKEDTIGAKIGKEAQFNAYLAVALAILAILIYIAFRFEFIFGLGAVIALAHDVIFTFAVIIVVHHLGLINLELNQGILAAMLTVVGYSINDTVIIFDRIRENKDKQKGLPFVRLINQSINETLSRTINTVLTVVLVLMTMVILAGPVLQGFAFTMLVGIFTGTYSSIYIASSFVIWYNQKVKKINVTGEITKKEALSPTS